MNRLDVEGFFDFGIWSDLDMKENQERNWDEAQEPY